ncbi:MAG: hypothetical protein ABIO70_14960 [Pseudomonadota bacterium]
MPPALASSPRPPPRRPRAGSRWLEVVAPLALALLAAGIGELIRARIHPGLPIGNDMDLWSLGAEQLHRGYAGMVQPGYPALASLLMFLPGVDHVDATSALSAVGMALLPAATWGLARRMGAGRWASAWAGLLVIATPRLLIRGQQITPDPLAALGLLGVAWAAARLDGKHRERDVALLVVATAALFAAREHGLICAGVVALLLMALPGSVDVRFLRVGGLLMGMLLLPAMLGNDYDFRAPPWWGRFEMVFRDFFASTPSWASKAGAHGPSNSRLGLAMHAIGGAPWAWVWVGLGLAGAWIARGRRVAWVALVPVLPALVVFSQPRHVLVAVPVAGALIAAGSARLSGRLRAGALAVLTLLAAGGLCGDLPAAQMHLRDLVTEATELQRVGEDLCALSGGDGLAAGEMRDFTFCPMGWYDLGVPSGSALWKVFLMAERSPGDAWERVELPQAHRGVFRLASLTPERPCATSRVPDGISILPQGQDNPQLVPPCTAPLPAGAERERRGPPPR